MFITALVGIVVNIAAAWLISKANRTSLNVEGAFQHILNDLYAFIATAIAGLVVVLTGFARADSIAALVVAGADDQSRLRPGPGVRPDLPGGRPGRARPGRDRTGHGRPGRCRRGARPAHLGRHLRHARPVRACPGRPHAATATQVRRDLEVLLTGTYQIDHTTLQVDHRDASTTGMLLADPDCAEPHGPVINRPS